MPCIFGKNDNKIEIGIRKPLLLKRPSKKSPDNVSVMFYLPIHKDEAVRLGLNEESLLKAELALLPTKQEEEVNFEQYYPPQAKDNLPSGKNDSGKMEPLRLDPKFDSRWRKLLHRENPS
jgi:hypothetical protein